MKDLKNLVRVTVVIALLLFIFYLINFRNGLSSSNELWGQFGDFFGGVLNPLLSIAGLIAVSLTFYHSEKENRDSRDDATRMENRKLALDLIRDYQRKSDSLTIQAFYKSNDPKPIIGSEAYKILYAHFEDKMFEEIREYIIENRLSFWIYFDDNMKERFQTDLWGNYKYKNAQITEIKMNELSSRYSDWDLVREVFALDTQNIIWGEFTVNFKQSILNTYDQYIDENKDVELITKAYNSYFEDRGYLVGHVIRNFANVLEFINKTIRKDEAVLLGRIIRSNMSGFEIILLFYNCIAGKSKFDFNARIIDFEIIDDIGDHKFIHNKKYKSLLNRLKTSA